MNRFLLSLVLLINTFTYAQISQGGKPFSQTHTIEQDIETKYIAKVSDTWKKNSLKHSSQYGTVESIGKAIKTNFTLENSGTWLNLKNGDRLWRLKIIAKESKAINTYFENFTLPINSKLFIYNEDYSQVLGAFDNSNNHESKQFATELIYGNTVIIEYYEPREQKDLGNFTISEIGNIYKNVYNYKETEDFGQSNSCQVNINCSEGNNWQDEKRGVARILVKNGNSLGWCSGSLVNNTNLDCKPYFLTAYHCGDNASSANFNDWIFYFNYEFNGCANSSEPTPNSITGASVKARSNDLNSNTTSSDFLLLELNQLVPTNYNVYYNGWNNLSSAPSSGVSIHHPAGDVKKISTFTSSPSTVGVSWSGNGYTITNGSTHWSHSWANTTNGHGVTEGGSSGSPLFDNNGFVIGTLSGGDSNCTSGINNNDQYGKISYHWESNSTSQSRQLKPWLDPINSGVNTLGGTNNPCTAATDNDASIYNVISPKGDLCNNAYTPRIILKNSGAIVLTSATISYTINSGTPITINWNGSLTKGATEEISLQSGTTANATNTFSVTVSNPNGIQDDDNSNNTINTTFNTNVQKPLPLHETFETAELKDLNWRIINPDNDKSWENTSNIGSFGTSDNCMFIDYWDYDSQGQYDWFISESYNLSDTLDNELYFDLAYTYYHQTNGTNESYDTLGIAFSLDCGDNYYWLWKEGGKELATLDNGLGEEFVPLNDEWKHKTISLDFIKGNPSVIFAFVAINGYGNNMYIDNIGVGKVLLPINDEDIKNNSVLIYPNPANDILTISFVKEKNISYHIINTLGQTVISGSKLNTTIDISNLNKGVYYIKTQDKKGNKYRSIKFIKS